MSQSPFQIELDEMTLARARRGDMDACEHIYRLFSGPAYSIAFRVCQCTELAQEVSQEAFITAFRRIRQFRGDAPFWGWLRRVVINHAISALRKRPKTEAVELEEHHAWEPGSQERIGMSLDLEAALAMLSADDRTIVWLHDVEGYNHADIAALFEKTESFSKTRLSRLGRKKQAPDDGARRMTAKVLHMNKPMSPERDPLNLSGLPMFDPPEDGWPAIASALEASRARDRRRRMGGWLAAAATVTLALGFYFTGIEPTGPVETLQPELAHGNPPQGAVETREAPQLASLMEMSSKLEGNLRLMRSEVSDMPIESMMVQIELEDLVAQVDDALSIDPESEDLWAQRVNLLVDLAQFYQGELRREHSRLASL
jgi:RNA polymerase sigma-70 factor (ECF subfamily)